MILQHINVFQRVPVHEDQIRVVANLDLAHLVGAEHQFGYPVGGCDDGFVRREAHQRGEVGEVAGVGAVRGPGEAVVSTVWEGKLEGGVLGGWFVEKMEGRGDLPARQDDNASTMHLAKSTQSNLEFLLISDLLGLFARVAKCGGVLERRDQPIDRRCDDVLGLGLFQHVHAFFVDVGAVVDDVHAVLGKAQLLIVFETFWGLRPGKGESYLDTHLDGIAGAGVGADGFADFVGFVHASKSLVVVEIAVLSGADFADLRWSLSAAPRGQLQVYLRSRGYLPLRQT